MQVHDGVLSNEEFTGQSRAMLESKRKRKANIYPFLQTCSIRTPTLLYLTPCHFVSLAYHWMIYHDPKVVWLL